MEALATEHELTSVLRAAREGDPDAFEELYQATILELKSWVAYHCYRWDMVEDCLQQTYISAYHALADFDMDRPVLPWLKGIARHHIGKYIRSQQRVQNREHQAFLMQQQERLTIIEDQMSDDQDIAPRLSDCLSRMGEHLRDLIWQRYVEQKSVQQIAEVAGKTANALSVVLHRARRALKNCVAQSDASVSEHHE